jgi:hypothetical protein
MSVFKSRFATVFTAAAVLVIFSSLSAVGAGMITSKKIKNDTIRSVDIHNGTIGMRDLNDNTKSQIRQHSAAQAPQSAQAPAPPGKTKYDGPNWSIVDRNVEGNGDSYLRSGPSAGADVKPPLGNGSLGIRTGSGTDKAVFGNQVDFAGTALTSLNTLKYSVFVTGEDLGRYDANAPNLQFEVDPHLGAFRYSTLTYVPAAGYLTANAWSELDASTAKQWYLTGSKNTTGCDQNNYCTLDEVKSKIADATLLDAQISKGKDYAFSGAVDKLVVNDTTYDFEPFGVTSN